MTKSKVITYAILFILLASRIEINTVTFISGSFSNTNVIPVWFNWLSRSALVADGIYEIFSVPLIIIVIWLNRDDLHSLNVDNLFIFILIYTGLAVLIDSYELGSSLGMTAALFTVLLVGFPSGISMLFFTIYLVRKNKLNFGDPNPKVWRLSLIVIGIFIVFFIGLSDFFNIQKIQQTISLFFLKTIPDVVYEEMIYRGLLWMFLKDLNWSQSKIFFFTGILFWFSHLDHLPDTPVDFWIFIPVLSLLLGFLVLRSKSITPSIIAHSLVNGLINIMQ